MGARIKNGIFVAALLVLCLPLIQQNYPFFTSGKLDGWFTSAPPDTFSVKRWWSGAYQAGTNDYTNDHMGFRNELIRVNNQLEFSLFDKTHSLSIVIGKERYLYQGVYINSYYGNDFVGYDPIREKLRKLKALQDTFAAMGKTIVVVHAPCKAYYYPEYIPDRLIQPKRTATNFEVYKRVCDSMGINQLDFNSWYVSLKNKGNELLYPKQAFHWSVYGSLLAADTFTRYIEKCRNIKMPHPVWDNIEHSNTPRYTDADIAKTCDIIFPTAVETFSYPVVHYKADATASRPKTVYIGDSFLLTWMYDGLMQNTNTDWQIWYYFRLLYDKDHNEETPELYVGNTDWLAVLKKADCVVFMYTAHNLKEMGNGLIEQAYGYYFEGK